MFIDEETEQAIFIERPNRFVAKVIRNSKSKTEDVQVVHVPNTGRCKEILIPGAKVIIRRSNNRERKTEYDLIAAYKNGRLINIDSQIPNRVVEEALKNKMVLRLKEFKKIEREKTFGKSRFDFKLSEGQGEFEEYYLEVKGVTLEKDGIVSFPDAPTERGRKHLLELMDVKKSGRGAGILFLIQMEEAEYFVPNDVNDKAFGEALRGAALSGVDVFAYNCCVGEKNIELKTPIKVIL